MLFVYHIVIIPYAKKYLLRLVIRPGGPGGASAFGRAHGVPPPPGPSRPPQPQELGLLRHQIQLEMRSRGAIPTPLTIHATQGIHANYKPSVTDECAL